MKYHLTVLTFFLVLLSLGNLSRGQEDGERPVITPDNAYPMTFVSELPLEQLGSLAWSPDGATLAAIGDGDIYLYNLHDLDAPPAQIEGDFLRITYKPDGTLLAFRHMNESKASNKIQVVDVVDVQSGETLATLNIEVEFFLGDFAFSSDRTMLALGDDRSHIQLWDLARGEQIGILEGHEVPPWTLAFSPDNRYLASGAGTGDHLVFLWDIATLSPVRVLSDVPNLGIPAEVVAFSPDGQWFITGTSRGEPLVRWDAEALLHEPEVSLAEIAEERVILIGGLGGVDKVAFSPDSRLLAAIYSSTVDRTRHYVSLLDLATGTPLVTWERSGEMWDLSFSPDGTLLATISYEGDAIQLWGIPRAD